MFSKEQLHFTFSTKQPNALCKPAPLHPLPGPRPSLTGHGATDTTKARALSVPESERRRTQPGPLVKEYCSLSGSLVPPPEVSQRGFPWVCVQAALLHSMYPLSQPLSKASYSDRAANFGTIHYQAGQQLAGRLPPLPISMLPRSGSGLGPGVPRERGRGRYSLPREQAGSISVGLQKSMRACYPSL